MTDATEKAPANNASATRPVTAVIANDIETAKRNGWPVFTITVDHANELLCRLADSEAALDRALALLERAEHYVDFVIPENPTKADFTKRDALFKDIHAFLRECGR